MHSSRFSFAFVLVGVAMTPLAWGQPAYVDEELINVEVSGRTTVALYVELVQEEASNRGQEINVILQGDAGSKVVGPLHLHRITPLGAIQILKAVSNDVLIQMPDVESSVPTVVLHARYDSALQDPFVTFSTSVADIVARPNEITDGRPRYSPDDLITALKIGIDFRQQQLKPEQRYGAVVGESVGPDGQVEILRPNPTIKLHQETGLLFIAAPEDEIEFLHDLLVELRDSLPGPSNAARHSEILELKDAIVARDQQLAELRTQVETLQRKLDVLNAASEN